VGTVGPTAKFDVVGGDIRIDNGNLIIGTSGKGIDFSATPGTGTSELLADYEEGTWTVVWQNLTGTPSSTTGFYTKIGRQVFFTYEAGATAITGTFNSTNFTLPFTPAVDASGSMISGFITNGGSVYLYDSNGKAYPESFSSELMVFSGVYHV
jgi:hypothetical protein